MLLVNFLILSLISSLSLLVTTSEAPKSDANEVLNLYGSTDIIYQAPIKFDLIKWNKPIGPVPKITTVSPLLKGSHSDDHCLALSRQPVTERGSIYIPNLGSNESGYLNKWLPGKI